MNRQRSLKTVLWGIVGVLLVVTLARFINGLGVTTNLSDTTPWGFWIAFDVMAGVALAAGGFVLAATVYVFHLERYRVFVRSAILTALLGYMAVAVGLLYDLGLPWHIWHPLVHPQVHSVLFEVAMCVMLYLSVLFLEFSPAILEHRLFDRPLFRSLHSLVKTVHVPLVIAGIVLSTLHQSSLGSLFLIVPHRLHPLWYSPVIWVLFFVSAVGLGLMMVTLESYFSAWYFRHKLRIDLLSRLARAASFVLLTYAALRLIDVTLRGHLGTAFSFTFPAFLFWFELCLSALLPGVLLAFRRIRENAKALGVLATSAVLGIIGYRFDVCIVAFQRAEGMSYFPSWMELAVSAGIVAGALLIFIFAVENLRVFPEESSEFGEAAASSPGISPYVVRSLLPNSLAAPRRYSLAILIGAALAIAMLPEESIYGALPPETPVFPARTVNACVEPRDAEFGHEYLVAEAEALPPGREETVALLLLDGNRDGRLVAFDHTAHSERENGDQSCVLCHHQDLPFRRDSGCYECHADMYLQTDVFDHERHINQLAGNQSCERCHLEASHQKTRDAAKECEACHVDMVVKNSRIKPAEQGLSGFAAGYMDAMHKLCVECHQEKTSLDPQRYPAQLAECATCHRDLGGSQLKEMWPYVSRPTLVSTQ